MCTTEIGRLALKYDELVAMDVKLATLSVDPVKSHEEWLTDVVAHCENKIEIKFPIIGDMDRSMYARPALVACTHLPLDGARSLPLCHPHSSTAYGMIDPGTSASRGCHSPSVRCSSSTLRTS